VTVSTDSCNLGNVEYPRQDLGLFVGTVQIFEQVERLQDSFGFFDLLVTNFRSFGILGEPWQLPFGNLLLWNLQPFA
jgi:hypothetical protein